jgi:hypothetical protein
MTILIIIIFSFESNQINLDISAISWQPVLVVKEAGVPG